uniref:Putative gypsy nogag n=1 Tax=Ixodes ricinus TaxID=34613 RepID=A0A0K8RBQ2_IXORI
MCFVSNVTSETMMRFLTAVFSREGYPDELVTDRGPQLTSTTFEVFLRQRGIKHSCSSIYYPQSNGQVERFNRVLKHFVQLASLEQRPLQTAVLEYLAVYRSTPQATTGMPPAVLLHGRAPRPCWKSLGGLAQDSFVEPQFRDGQTYGRE